MNEGMCEKADAPEPKNTRIAVERTLEANLIASAKVLGLVRMVGDALFGAKPVEACKKEDPYSTGGILSRVKDAAIKTRGHLDEARDELEEILKELK